MCEAPCGYPKRTIQMCTLERATALLVLTRRYINAHEVGAAEPAAALMDFFAPALAICPEAPPQQVRTLLPNYSLPKTRPILIPAVKLDARSFAPVESRTQEMFEICKSFARGADTLERRLVSSSQGRGQRGEHTSCHPNVAVASCHLSAELRKGSHTRLSLAVTCFLLL